MNCPILMGFSIKNRQVMKNSRCLGYNKPPPYYYKPAAQVIIVMMVGKNQTKPLGTI